MVPASATDLPPGVRKQGYLHNKQSGSFNKTWVDCYLVVRDDAVVIGSVRSADVILFRCLGAGVKSAFSRSSENEYLEASCCLSSLCIGELFKVSFARSSVK